MFISIKMIVPRRRTLCVGTPTPKKGKQPRRRTLCVGTPTPKKGKQSNQRGSN
jgi:hypothetical protein